MLILSNNKLDIIKLIKEYSNQGQKYYVYILIRPDKNEPFYVGKGKNQRLFEHEIKVNSLPINNSYKVNIIKKILESGSQLIYGIDSFFDNDEDALERECKLIAEIGRASLGAGTLTNLTEGGDGFIGLIDFNKHARSGRNLGMSKEFNLGPGNINVLMEKTGGITEEALLDYIRKELYLFYSQCDENYQELQPKKLSETYDLSSPNEFFTKYEWEYYLDNGYGAEHEIYYHLYGNCQDIALKVIKLNQKIGDRYFRIEDEMKAFIRTVFSSETWLEMDDIKQQIRLDIIDYKQPSESELDRFVTHFIDELVRVNKIIKNGDKIRWNKQGHSLKFSCQDMKASEVIYQIEKFCYRKKDKDACVEFYSSNEVALYRLILFPHHFRHGLKTYFKQKIVLALNTNHPSFLVLHTL